ncbi:hypothetical protein MYAM1_002597 [Malassezia yamatoensis]|uniref:Uncharacterized protein n=1 Tax=Malassezia yamatoensis TaxID=253288 RepID=A0AAJ6CJH0_9BASI|nr:hypothetical protein MYAM1_002597 [Malassezia yamatoensis]
MPSRSGSESRSASESALSPGKNDTALSLNNADEAVVADFDTSMDLDVDRGQTEPASDQPDPGSEDASASATPTAMSPGPDTKPSRRSVKLRRSVMPNSISAVAASLTLEELDALPSAKRRKSLKTRGAPGPGRGWRKGLSKGQKPVYRLPEMDVSTADVRQDPDKLPVQAVTPNSFSTSGTSRKSKSNATNNKSENVPLVSATIRVLPNSADAVFKYPSMPNLKEAPSLLPLPRIPNFIPSITPLQKSDLKPRHWKQGRRELLNIAGRSWRAPTWLTEQESASSMKQTQDTDKSMDTERASTPSKNQTDSKK